MSPTLTNDTRRSATPCLVAAFDELHSSTGNQAIRNMIDQRPYDPDQAKAMFDRADLSKVPMVERVLLVTCIVICCATIVGAVMF